MYRKDGKRIAKFKIAQQLLNKDMTTKSKPSSSKAKKTGLETTSPANRTAFGELKNVESKTPDFPSLSSFTRMDCRLMLLNRRV